VRRALTVLGSTVAAFVLVLSFLFIPLSLVTQEYGHVLVEIVLALASLAYVTRVMRADRRERRIAETLLPPERRPARRAPRQPITFQVRETLVAMAIWFVLVFAFDALVLGLGTAANAGIAFFAAFMLATLTVTGRHMMFRLTQDDD
jgi:predicted Co/Zn/Cd cation transporter (cation efflux family)